MAEGTAIVVPCRNEERRLAPARFLAHVDREPGTRFLFVDDASTDRTREVLERLVEQRPEALSIVALEAHGGKAEAVRRGVLSALEAGPAYIGYWDADLATPLDAIADLRHVLETRPDVDIVLGSRVQLLGRDIRRRAVRHYLGRVFATAASLVLELAVYDTQCGAKLFRAGPYLIELFGEPFRSRWIFDVELLARYTTTREARSPSSPGIYEFPLREWRDVEGSLVRLGDFFRAPWELWTIYLRYRRRGSQGER